MRIGEPAGHSARVQSQAEQRLRRIDTHPDIWLQLAQAEQIRTRIPAVGPHGGGDRSRGNHVRGGHHRVGSDGGVAVHYGSRGIPGRIDPLPHHSLVRRIGRGAGDDRRRALRTRHFRADPLVHEGVDALVQAPLDLGEAGVVVVRSSVHRCAIRGCAVRRSAVRGERHLTRASRDHQRLLSGRRIAEQSFGAQPLVDPVRQAAFQQIHLPGAEPAPLDHGIRRRG